MSGESPRQYRSLNRKVPKITDPTRGRGPPWVSTKPRGNARERVNPSKKLRSPPLKMRRPTRRQTAAGPFRRNPILQADYPLSLVPMWQTVSMWQIARDSQRRDFQVFANENGDRILGKQASSATLLDLASPGGRHQTPSSTPTGPAWGLLPTRTGYHIPYGSHSDRLLPTRTIGIRYPLLTPTPAWGRGPDWE